MTDLVQARRIHWIGGERSQHKEGTAVRRIAIVGLLPQGLSVFERVLSEASAATDCHWAIDLFEPHPVPGAGSFYDPSQPNCLRTEQTAEQLSLWETAPEQASPWVVRSGRDIAPIVAPQSLLQWADARGYRIAAGECVPRCLVGRYLHDTFCRLCLAAPAHVTVTLTPYRVEGIRRDGRRWIVVQRQAAATVRRRRCLPIPIGPTGCAYDRVFVTTPEPPRRSDASLDLWHREAWKAGHAVIDHVYPTRERLSLAEVPPRRSVAVRGLGSAAVDAILALTEARGGLFVADGGAERHARRYLRGWREPSRICVFSMNGRLPSPRPLATVESGQRDGRSAEVAAVWQRSRELLVASTATEVAPSLWHDFLPALVDATVARWSLSHGVRPVGEKIRQATDRWTRRLYALAAGRYPLTANSVGGHAVDVKKLVERWRQEARIAWGEQPLSLRAASAQAWRQLAPLWLRASNCRGSTAGESDALQRLNRYFAPLAGGPPAESVSRILALVDAGLVDLSCYRSPRVTVDAAGFHLRAGQASQAVCRTLIAPPVASDEPLMQTLSLRETEDGCFVVAPAEPASRQVGGAIASRLSFPGR